MCDSFDQDGYDPAMLAVVDRLKTEFFPEPEYDVDDIVLHSDGTLVRITSGYFWDGDGPERRLSNHWTWHPVDDAGNRAGPDCSGYGNQLLGFRRS